MNFKKRFSFVIPTFQKKLLLYNTLETLNDLEGYDGRFEAVVVDDGSTDGTEELVKRMEKKFDCKYVYLPRCDESSRSRTRNRGIERSEGEIVIFIDSDMLVRPDYLKEMDRCFKNDMDIVVIGNRVMLSEDVSRKEILSKKLFGMKKMQLNRLQKIEMRHLIYNSISYNASNQIYPWLQVFSCNMAVPRIHLDKAGYFDEKFKGWGGEDVELGYRLFKNGKRIIINNNIEAYHQYHEGATGLYIPPERYPDIERNTAYMLEKHPEAMPYPAPIIIRLFKGKFFLRLNEMRARIWTFRINLRDERKLEDIKARVLKYSRQKVFGVAVVDYLENTGIDMWIQLLGKCDTIPYYVPASKIKQMRRVFDLVTFVRWGVTYYVMRLNCTAWQIYYWFKEKYGKKRK
jgi:glycosyltransferase involved in cell wall biosynthesis